MITTKHGSIFDSTAQVLVCPVNCVGVMGKGLALEFKRRWPEIYERYRDDCDRGGAKGGDVWDYDSKVLIATKQHWRNRSKAEWINRGLATLAYICCYRNSIALPQLGCGCGGLDWADVWPLYEKHLGSLDCDVEVWIYE